MLALIDGDHLVWRAAGSCEPTKAKPFLESKEDAFVRFDMMMNNIIEDVEFDTYEFYISGEGNWRYAIYPEYKATRKDKPPPTWKDDVREYAISQWKAKIANDIEVDDMCGIRLTQEGKNAFCVSLDKDLLTVPGIHYNFVKKVYQSVDKTQALRYFYKQLITGDASDNVPAFDGKFRTSIPKFIEALLKPIDDMKDEMDMYLYACHLYCQDESVEDIMIRNAKVLYIQQYEGAMWQPPGQREENEVS